MGTQLRIEAISVNLKRVFFHFILMFSITSLHLFKRARVRESESAREREFESSREREREKERVRECERESERGRRVEKSYKIII